MSYYNIESCDVRLSACWFVPHISENGGYKTALEPYHDAVWDVFRTSFILLFNF